jgi:hypothetical protein
MIVSERAPPSGAEDQQRLRLPGVGALERALAQLQLGAELEGLAHLVDLVEGGHRRRAGGREHDQHGAEQHALP